MIIGSDVVRRENTPRRQAGGFLRFLLIACIACFFSSCAASHKQIINTSPDIQQVTMKMLAALEKNDEQALEAMHITKEEFRTLIFPGLPIGKIKQWQANFDYVWGDVNTKSRYGLKTLLAAYGGKKLTFVDMKFRKGTTRYDLTGKFPKRGDFYIAHEDPRINAINDQGEKIDFKPFGAIIEYRGAYKIMSFNIYD